MTYYRRCTRCGRRCLPPHTECSGCRPRTGTRPPRTDEQKRARLDAENAKRRRRKLTAGLASGWEGL